MSNQTMTKSPSTTQTSDCASFGTTVPFSSVCDPGCYVCNWSGHLMRVPEDGVAAGRSPLINIVGPEPLFVTKISDNPYIPVTKARLLACNADCNVNF